MAGSAIHSALNSRAARAKGSPIKVPPHLEHAAAAQPANTESHQAVGRRKCARQSAGLPASLKARTFFAHSAIHRPALQDWADPSSRLHASTHYSRQIAMNRNRRASQGVPHSPVFQSPGHVEHRRRLRSNRPAPADSRPGHTSASLGPHLPMAHLQVMCFRTAPTGCFLCAIGRSQRDSAKRPCPSSRRS